MNKDKKIEMSKKSYISEHKRLVKELGKAGLKKEEKEQKKDLEKANK
jgi:hypothetical protein